MAQQYFKTGQSGCHSVCAGIFMGGDKKKKKGKINKTKNKKEINP